MNGETPAHRPRRSRRIALWGGIAVVAVVSGLALTLPTGPATDAEPAAAPPATEPVVRQTLEDQTNERGALGFGAPVAVAGARAGTITWLPEPGSVIDRGDPVTRVDDLPVVAVHGTMPLYRALEPGLRGPDVRQLKDNLAALGYHGVTDGDRYDRGTTRAVVAWQKALGVPQTGTVEPAAVVLLPGPVRVSAHRAQLGGSGNGALLTVTGTEQVVTFDLSATASSRATVGLSVGLTLPGGTETTGTITAVGPPQVPDDDDDDDDDSNPSATVRVTVRPDDLSAVEGLEAAPVDVTLRSGERPDVLTVPVTALLALAGGGYAVERVSDDGRTSLVPVTTGMFSGGRVEISPADDEQLSEGDDVVVPS